ncbi:hypothetical protein [Tumebacillus permanentifrigoris]|uniref:Fibronectin type-III domain-containing protein n=1 Tax=Tumebacillus permanentifrigoris TaxID=378543 RepID=A0A316D9S6_9BACL|nr:hypothetical protein [Tumebacillus permanentifrigoris]PWK13945.1 hypothetical protein C7459_106234 [Tumebacillus permanentifrigoris]
MKSLRFMIASTFIVGALSFGSVAAFASPGLGYYSFGPGFGSGSFTTPVDSPVFTVTNSSKVCTINGWQDSGTNVAPANIDYSIYQYHWYSNTLKGMKNFSQNYPKVGSWYSFTFTNIDPSNDYFIRMTPHNSAGMSGAGNAYDGY